MAYPGLAIRRLLSGADYRGVMISPPPGPGTGPARLPVRRTKTPDHSRPEVGPFWLVHPLDTISILCVALRFRGFPSMSGPSVLVGDHRILGLLQ